MDALEERSNPGTGSAAAIFRKDCIDLLEHAMTEAGWPMALLVVGMDGFSSINRGYGFPVGDQILTEAAVRLGEDMQGVRFIGRLEEDLFALLVKAEGVNDSNLVAERLLKRLREPFFIGWHEVHASACAGIALSGDGKEAPEEMFRQACMALAQAKKLGRNHQRIYDPTMDASPEAMEVMRKQLQRAIVAGELDLLYQPKVSLETGCVTGVEALLRWRDSEWGYTHPAVIVQISESLGMAQELGARVLEMACAQIRDWSESEGLRVPVSINLCSPQLLEGDFTHLVAGALSRHAVDPWLLALEIPEATVAEHRESIDLPLRQLCSLGVRLSLDDFGGGGQSRLSLLRHLPVFEVKLDRSLIWEIEANLEDQAVVTAVAGLGKALGISVLAKGVEGTEQLQMVAKLGCDAAQGFVLGRPVLASEVIRRVRGQADGVC